MTFFSAAMAAGAGAPSIPAGGGAVTPSFEAAGAGDDATDPTGLSIPYPAGIVAGQKLVLQLASRTVDCIPAAVSGWTQIQRANTAHSRQHAAFIKTATGSESGSLAVTLDATPNVAAGRMYNFDDCADVAVEDSGIADSADQAVAGPSIPTNGNNRLCVLLFFSDEAVSLAAMAGESGGDWTEPVAEYATTAGSDLTLGINVATMDTAGTISGGSINLGGDGGKIWFALPGTGT